LYISIFQWKRHRNLGLIFNGLYGVISQKIELFIITALRTSNCTFYQSLSNNYPPSRGKEGNPQETCNDGWLSV
jgi:hypothetical protein